MSNKVTISRELAMDAIKALDAIAAAAKGGRKFRINVSKDDYAMWACNANAMRTALDVSVFQEEMEAFDEWDKRRREAIEAADAESEKPEAYLDMCEIKRRQEVARMRLLEHEVAIKEAK